MESPCNLVCTIDTATGWCRGCGRTLDEIARWSGASDTDRAAIWRTLDARLAAMGVIPPGDPPAQFERT